MMRTSSSSACEAVLPVSRTKMWMFSSTKKYSRGAEYVNGSAMFIGWQFIPIDMPKNRKM
jgi:hypothetical protein